MSVSFEDFWTKLTDDEQWYDFTKLRFHRKNMREAAQDCYAFLLASTNRWQAQDYQDFRRCYLNFLKNAKDAQIVVTHQVTEDKVASTEPIVTGDARDAWIKKWMSEVQQIPAMKSAIPKLTYKEIADEGDWLPKKPAPYPSAPESFLIEEELKIQYARECTDIYTGRLKPGMPSFEDWIKDKP